MPRPPRHDYAGAVHHVMNRALGHRPLFESESDLRFFEACVAHASRKGMLETCAYSLLTTHYHLFSRSPEGKLGIGMHWVQNAYARWFNRTRKRDGPLFRGRFRSKLVEDPRYRDAVVWYIDQNPVVAGLARLPAEYPYGSAYHFHRAAGPAWLSRGLVESMYAGRHGGAFDPAKYGISPSPHARLFAVIDRFTTGRSGGALPLKDLIGAAPAHVQQWLAENARRADGGRVGTLILDPRTVREELAAMECLDPSRCSSPDGSVPDAGWRRLEAGLLHTVAGQTMMQIATSQATPYPTAFARVEAHRRSMASDCAYRDLAAEILQRGIQRDYAPILESDAA